MDNYKMKSRIFLFLIVILGLFIRLYSLDRIPSGFYWDETAAGYDAYSILKTGHDFHGKFLPLAINRFDIDIDTGIMYTYLSVIPIYLLGLSIFSVRLVAALAGTLTIISVYLLVKELLDRNTALLSAFLIAVSPHHLIFSRWAHQGILVPLFTTAGLLLIFKTFKKPSLIIPTAILWGLSFYTYAIVKVFIPLVFILIFLFYTREVLGLFASKDRQALYGSIISVIIISLMTVLPYYYTFFGSLSRFNFISVFRTADPAGQFFSNMLSHLSPSFLFFKGDSNFRHNVPGFGVIFPVLIPFILLGLIVSAHKKKREILFLFCLFLAGSIPASLTYEGIPHALRSISSLPFLEIIAAYGMLISYKYLKDKKLYIRVILSTVMFTMMTTQIVFFLYSYFIQYPAISEHWFQYGLKEAVEYAEEHINTYDRIIFSQNSKAADVTPMFFAKKDPVEFRKTRNFGKYFFCKKNIEDCYGIKGKNLFIVLPQELPSAGIKKIIPFSSGGIAYKLVE